MIGWLIDRPHISIPLFIVLSLTFIFGRCYVFSSNENSIKIIAEKDGCTVYEIKRPWVYPVYFTKCGSTQWRVPSGKTTRRVENTTSWSNE